MSEVVWWLVLCLAAFCVHACLFHNSDAGDAMYCETYRHHGWWHDDCDEDSLSWLIVLLVAGAILYVYNHVMSAPPPATAQMTKHVAKAATPSTKTATAKKKLVHQKTVVHQSKAAAGQHKTAVGAR